MKKEYLCGQLSNEQFLKNGGFKIHYFSKNNIHSIKTLLSQTNNQQSHSTTSKNNLTQVRKVTQTQKISPDCQQSTARKNNGTSNGKQETQTNCDNPINGELSLKQKVHNIIKLSLTSAKTNSIEQPAMNADIFREKIKHFISAIKWQQKSRMESSLKISQEKETLSKENPLMNQDHMQIQTKEELAISSKQRQLSKKQRIKALKKKKRKKLVQQVTDKNLPPNSQQECQSRAPSDPLITKSCLRSSAKKLLVESDSPTQPLQPVTNKSKIITKSSFESSKAKRKEINIFQALKDNQQAQEKVEIKKCKQLVVTARRQIQMKSQEKIVKKKYKNEKNQQNYEIEKYQELLINSLPSRHPKVLHSHNALDSNTVSLLDDIKGNSMYFVSEIMTFHKKKEQLFINCTKNCLNFIEDTLRTSKNCKEIPALAEHEIKKIKLKRNFQYNNKKVLVLDLDQTLVHSLSLNETPNKEIFPFDFEFDGVVRHYTIRNYAKQFVANLAEKYYIVVFTSAVQGYADNIIEHIDPEEKYIQHRLYRYNCYLYAENCPYIKDLRILNRDLSQIIIVDNSLYAYWFNIDNGVPITPFTGRQDNQLMKLQGYLAKLENVDDVRQVNRRAFHMHLFQETTSPAELLGKYCELMNKEIGVDSTKESEATSKEDKNTVVIDLSD